LSLGVLQVVISSQGQLDTCWLDATRSAAAAALFVKPSSSSSSSRARQQQVWANNSRNSSSSLQAGLQPAAQQAGAAVVQAESDAVAAAAAAAVSAASPGKPCRVPGTGLQAAGCSSCGWLFDQQDMFDQKLLLQLLQLLQPHVVRLKGVFRVAQKQWVMPQFLGTPLQQQQQHGNESSGQMEQQQQQQQTPSCVGSAAGQEKGLQLQPICYRGPSMVEVIVSAAPVIAAGVAGDAATVVANPLSRELADFLQQQKERCGAAAGSSNSSSKADDAAVGVGRLTLSCAGIKLVDSSTWQIIEDALLVCLQQRD
jgi:hypothetical protein